MQVLIIDTLTREAISRVRLHAEDFANHFPLVGRNPKDSADKHRVEIPLGFRAVYTIDNAAGMLHKHLSISLPGNMATPQEAREISLAFGFDLEDATLMVDERKIVHVFGTYHVIH